MLVRRPAPATADVFEEVLCVVCGSDQHEVVHEARYAGSTRDPVETFRASGDQLLVDRLVRCRECQFQYVSPRLRGDVILTCYAEGDDPLYVSQVDARMRTFLAAIDEIERATGHKGRLLDVGTAAGAFVAAAARRGWDAQGCEPNRWLAEWGAKHFGIRVRQGDLLQQSYPDQSFDVITLWDVIEHTPDPRAVLDRCHRLLRPGGVLIVNYPDIGSWVARALGRRWLFLTSVHLWYFDRRTIRTMLEKSGFKVERIRPHVQRLELDYILFRGAILSQSLSRAARAIVGALRLGRAQVPYWLGQTFVLSRKLTPVLWLLCADAL
jgi:2-polyprenyl-3-methyl-5-hydroxy-6-metoxy-1,4-benzoquinol methylase